MQNADIQVGDIFADLPTMETERLLLRKISMDDAEDMFEYARDAEVARYVLWHPHKTIEDSRQFISLVLDEYAKGGVAPWGIEYKADKRFVGTVGFLDWSIPNARIEIGYAISRAYWGQGIMTEAVRAVIDLGFRNMALNRIQAMCLPENVASARVMEKAGMRYEGTLRQYLLIKGEFRDLKMYSILRDEWER
jgi:[ribosomal protein S5]-alanine N-acetyltransferase